MFDMLCYQLYLLTLAWCVRIGIVLWIDHCALLYAQVTFAGDMRGSSASPVAPSNAPGSLATALGINQDSGKKHTAFMRDTLFLLIALALLWNIIRGSLTLISMSMTLRGRTLSFAGKKLVQLSCHVMID